MKSELKDINQNNRVFLYLAVAVGLVLAVPLLAMQFYSGVNWSPLDFITAGFLLLSVGSLYILLSRRFPSRQLFLTIIVGLLLIYAWVELAVGIFFNFGN